MNLTKYHAKYFAYELTRQLPSNDIGKLTSSLQDAQVDLNPHQVEAALFAFKSPLSHGAILADEVGLGKTIEAGIILSQQWAERKRQLIIICPANLRKQWNQELADKFFLPSIILETKSFNQYIKEGHLNPFYQQDNIIICSFQFAKAKASYLEHTTWDLVIIDEAHRLRNVYKTSNKIGAAIKTALAERKKVLLTATPLHNSILELYGLVSIIDDYVFGDLKSFKSQYSHQLDAEIKLRKAEAKKMFNPEAKVKAQRQIKDLEKKRSDKRQTLFEAQDQIDERKEALLTDIEKKAIELTYFDEFPDGLFRKKIRHFDARLVRELLINAIAHKSYTISGDIFIKVFPDRLEISNPGGLPLGITKENILQSVSRRNPHLIRVLHDLKLMEGEGSGYDLIYEITGRDAKPFPVIFSVFNTTSVIQFSKVLDEEALLIMDFIAKNYPLSQKEFIVLRIVVRHNKILSTQLTKELQLSDDERMRSYVDRLLEQSILISRGIKKGTEYLINPKLIASAKINVKPTLKTIEPHRLKALLIEDLFRYPESKSSEIQKRIADLPIEEIRKTLLIMEREGSVVSHGAKKTKTYSVAKKN